MTVVSSPTRWVWQSISPGRRVRSGRSRTAMSVRRCPPPRSRRRCARPPRPQRVRQELSGRDVEEQTGAQGVSASSPRASSPTRTAPRSAPRRLDRRAPAGRGRGGRRLAGVISAADMSTDIAVRDCRTSPLPGLIDCHAHLVGDEDNGHGYSSCDPHRRPGGDGGVRNARDTLRAGFTSVRDVGTYRAFVDVALRDAIEAGWTPGPRMHGRRCLRQQLGRRGDISGLAPDAEPLVPPSCGWASPTRSTTYAAWSGGSCTAAPTWSS